VREDCVVEGILLHTIGSTFEFKNNKRTKDNQNNNIHVFPSYTYCKKNNHQHNKC